MTATLAKTGDPTLLSIDNVPATAWTERSAEFLSCAKTALKIGKKQHQNDPNPPPPNAWWQVSPADLRLLPVDSASAAAAAAPSRTTEILQDGLALLRTMEAELKQLETLVRRRGQTNDPTQAIAACTRRLEQDTQELTEWLPTIIPPTIRRHGQAFKHYTMIQEWFQQAANEQGKRLQEILKVRGKVLTEQARRRKLFQATSQARPGSTRKPVSADMNSNPLFQLAKPAVIPAKSQPLVAPTIANGDYGKPSNGSNGNSNSNGSNGNGNSAPTSSTMYPSTNSQPSSRSGATSSSSPRTLASPPGGGGRTGGYTYYAAKPMAGYGATYAATTAGYGGVSSRSGGGGGGMRQRRATAAASTDSIVTQQQQEQTLLLQRQQERQSRRRVAEAREAEKGLASLVGLFGKMSTLVSEQSEQIDKIEDDVEAAAVDVQAGQNEIAKVYSLKKGNRPLILRTFAILIFVIIFMRFYRG